MESNNHFIIFTTMEDGQREYWDGDSWTKHKSNALIVHEDDTTKEIIACGIPAESYKVQLLLVYLHPHY